MKNFLSRQIYRVWPYYFQAYTTSIAGIVFLRAYLVLVTTSWITFSKKIFTTPRVSSFMRLEILFIPPLRASLRTTCFMMPWMLSLLRTLPWCLALPFPNVLPLLYLFWTWLHLILLCRHPLLLLLLLFLLHASLSLSLSLCFFFFPPLFC